MHWLLAPARLLALLAATLGLASLAAPVRGAMPLALAPVEAVCLVLAAVSAALVGTTSRTARKFGLGLALVFGGIALHGVVAPATGWGILAGPISLGTAVGYMVAALALWLPPRFTVRTATAGLTLVAIVIVSHVLDLPSPDGFRFGPATSLPSASALLVLFITVLANHPAVGWLRLVTAPNARAQSTRALLLWVVFVPLIIGWVALAGERARLYDTSIRFALVTVATMVCLAFLVLSNASRSRRMERERRMADAATRRSEERLRLTTAATGVGIWDVNTATGDIYLSPEARTLLRFGQDEEVSRDSLAERLHPEDRDVVLPAVEELLAGSSPSITVEHRLKGPAMDGSDTWVAVNGSVVRQGTRMVRVVGTVIDITARKSGEERLQDAARRLELAIEAANVGMWERDLRNGEITWSPKCYEITGVRRTGATLDRAAFVAILHPEDAPRLEAAVADAIRERKTFDAEFRFMTPSGEVRWAQNRAGVVLDTDGLPVRLVGTLMDVTLRKESEANREALLVAERAARVEIERIGQLKDDFLATISHELRTPLNAIMGWLLLLKKPMSSPQVLADGLKVIERNVRVQAQLITDLFDINRIMSGKLSLELEPVDINQVVRETLQSVGPAAQAKGVTVRGEVQDAATLVEGDARRLQQVVANLLTNAIKFTPRGGTVTVTTHADGGQCQIQVTDTGEGIAAEFLPFLFERFRQGDASRSRKHGGLGLGLAITSELVALHGGTVRGESEGPGRGARFTVTLPVLVAGRSADGGGATGRWDTSAIQPASLAGLQVLIVDDQPDALDYVGRVLEEQGAMVVRASSGGEAIGHLKDAGTHFDVLVTDIGMPGMSGYDLLRIVRDELGMTRSKLPAIAVTAFAREEDRTRSVEAGFEQHLAKPVQVVELIHAVRSANAARESVPPMKPAKLGGA